MVAGGAEAGGVAVGGGVAGGGAAAGGVAAGAGVDVGGGGLAAVDGLFTAGIVGMSLPGFDPPVETVSSLG